MKTLVVLITLLGVFTCVNGRINKKSQVPKQLDEKFFIPNKGQWHNDVLFLCRMNGLDVWITKYGINYSFYQIQNQFHPEELHKKQQDNENLSSENNATLIGHRVLLKYNGHNPNPVQEGKLKLQGYHHYLIGNNPNKHAKM